MPITAAEARQELERRRATQRSTQPSRRLGGQRQLGMPPPPAWESTPEARQTPRVPTFTPEQQRQLEDDTAVERARQNARQAYSPLPDEAGPLVPLTAVAGDVVGALYDEMADAAGDQRARRRRLGRDERWRRGSERASQDILAEGHGGQLMQFFSDLPGQMDEAERARLEAGGRDTPLDRAGSAIGGLWTGMAAAPREARAEVAAQDVIRTQNRTAAAEAMERGDDIGANRAARSGQMAEEAGDVAAGEDFWYNAPWAAEFIPGVGLVDITVSAGRFGARQGLRAAGQEIPEALARPQGFSETQRLGARTGEVGANGEDILYSATGNARGWRNNALAGGAAYLGADAIDGEIGDDYTLPAIVAGGTMAFGRRFIPSIDTGVSAEVAAAARQGEMDAHGVRTQAEFDVSAATIAPETAGSKRMNFDVPGTDAYIAFIPANDGWHIQSSYLPPELREQGLGVRMYEELLERARRDGISTVHSDASVSEAAQRVYPALERRGYRVTRSAGPYGEKFQISTQRDGPNAGPRLGEDTLSTIAPYVAAGGAGYAAGELLNDEAQADDGGAGDSDTLIPILGAGGGAAALYAMSRRRLGEQFGDSVGMSGGRAPRRLGAQAGEEAGDRTARRLPSDVPEIQQTVTNQEQRIGNATGTAENNAELLNDARLSPDQGYAASRALAGQTPRQIAEEMDTTASYVRKLLSQARSAAPDLNIPMGRSGITPDGVTERIGELRNAGETYEQIATRLGLTTDQVKSRHEINLRRDRARTDLPRTGYHATIANVDGPLVDAPGGLGTGAYHTPDPQGLDDWFLRDENTGEYLEGANIVPERLPSLDRYVPVDQLTNDVFQLATRRGIDPDNADEMLRLQEEVTERYRQQGFVGVHNPDYAGGAGESVTWSASNRRAPWARMSQRNRKSSDPLASVAPIGVAATGAGLLFADEAGAEEVQTIDGMQIDPTGELPSYHTAVGSPRAYGEYAVQEFEDGTRFVFRVNRSGEQVSLEPLGSLVGVDYERRRVGEGGVAYDNSLPSAPYEPPPRERLGDKGSRIRPALAAGAGLATGLLVPGRYGNATRMAASGAATLAADAYMGGDLSEAAPLALATAGGGEFLRAGADDVARRLGAAGDDISLRLDPQFRAQRDAFARTLPDDLPSVRVMETQNYHGEIRRPDEGLFGAEPVVIPDSELAEQGYAYNRPVERMPTQREQFLDADPAIQRQWMDRVAQRESDAARVQSGREIQRRLGEVRAAPRETADPFTEPGSGASVFGEPKRPRQPRQPLPPLSERAAASGAQGAMRGVRVAPMRQIADDLGIAAEGRSAGELRKAVVRELGQRFDSTREMVAFLARYGVTAAALGVGVEALSGEAPQRRLN